jgi:hypothetical protein
VKGKCGCGELGGGVGEGLAWRVRRGFPPPWRGRRRRRAAAAAGRAARVGVRARDCGRGPAVSAAPVAASVLCEEGERCSIANVSHSQRLVRVAAV